jgi:hypothetical protein
MARYDLGNDQTTTIASQNDHQPAGGQVAAASRGTGAAAVEPAAWRAW